ncbi:MAG: HAD family hydrolase [Kiritimatiellae bacterium]|nr:HAD family hydrolase [Kiritimatiellia bacterium]
MVIRFSVVLWDWNGTLLDDAEASLRAVNAMLGRRGLAALGLARYRDCFTFPVRRFYTDAGFRLETEDWDALAREFHDLYARQEAHLFPDAAPCLAELARAGVRQSILSVAEQSRIDAQVAAEGVAGAFERVAGVRDLNGVSKRETGRALLRDVRAAPETTLLIGDTLHDAEVAEDLGVSCILVARGHQSEARLRRSGHPVFPALADAVAAVLKGGR